MFREGLRPPDPFGREKDPLAEARTQDGMTLKTLAEMSRVLVVCLPAVDGARRMLADLAAARAELENGGVRIVLVHMEEDVHAALEPHDLHYVARIADPARAVYGALEVGEAQRFLRGPAQLPGAFLLDGGEVVRAQRPEKPSARIDFRRMASG